MRGAACIINDLWDRDIDGKVSVRTLIDIGIIFMITGSSYQIPATCLGSRVADGSNWLVGASFDGSSSNCFLSQLL